MSGVEHVALKGLVGIILGYLAFCLVNAAILRLVEMAGGLCARSGLAASRTPTASSAVEAHFDTKQLCQPMGAGLVAGETYRLRVHAQAPIARPDGAPWHDASLPATPNGVLQGAAPWYMALFVPTRRHLSQPWFRLMVRVGERGSDVYAPDWLPRDGSPGGIYEATIRARRTGPLFLYVYDTVLLGGLLDLYGNNEGTARVVIRRAD